MAASVDPSDRILADPELTTFPAPAELDIELGLVELGIVEEGFLGMTGGALEDGTMGVEGPGIGPELVREVDAIAIVCCLNGL